jgi:hypothetical protein
MTLPCARPFAVFVAVAAIAGCGSGGTSLLPVEGKITSDNNPLTKGSIAFHPDAAKSNSSKKVAAADIAENGSYKLFTDGKPGAPAGWYKVTVVSAAEPDNTKPEAPVKSFVAPRYADPKLTDQSIEVKAGGSYDLKVSAK